MNRPREDERHGHGARVHGEDVLEGVDERLAPGELLVDGMD